VAVAGDLVDQANRYYEAVGPVEAGVRKLAAQGIRTVAVAGNHDHDILPEIATRLDPRHFTLLGRGGQWERFTLEKEGRALLHVDGWSFPSAWHSDDPLREYRRRPTDGIPVLGLLHADLEQPGSRHAPVALAALRALPVDFWLLGHVHRGARHDLPGTPSVLYPGSPQAMDPGETGAHGTWLVEVDAGGRFSTRHLPLSGVRYEAVDVDLEGVTEEAEVDRRVTDAVWAAARGVEEATGPLRILSLRLRLTGRTPLHRELPARSELATELEVEHGEILAVVERVEVATRPARDLEELARGQDAPAVLARLARGLERGTLDEEQRQLVLAAVGRAGEVRTARQYLRLADPAQGVEPADVAATLQEQAFRLLDELLAQKEAS
jgi:DNA repair exonuclease SbcCD nuclease subunit